MTTSSERLEHALHASEERYRLLFERNLAAIYRSSLAGRILECNDAWLKTFGFGSREEALAWRAASLYDRVQDRARLIDELLITGTVMNVEVRFRRKNGEAFWGLANMSLLPGTAGAEGIIEGTLVDITKQKEAEEELRASERRTRSIIENMVGGLITVSMAGVIELVNPAAALIFGYESDELIGKHLRVLMPSKPGMDPEAFLKEAFRKSLGTVTEWEGRRKNGTVFPFELSLFEFTTADGRHFAGNVRDVTERREVERLKAEFISTVSHELRTPLASIRGSLGLLAGGALGPLSSEAQEVVSIAERNVVRLVALINDILDLERLQTGRIPMQLAHTLVADLFVRSVEAVRGFAAPAGVAVESKPSTESAFVDADRITQVLVNLLSNAVKFSPRGSTVFLSAAAAGSMVEIRVTDQGRGIPRPLQQAVFERFRQVQASDSREKGGTGLGLAICKAIVEQHGGTVGVESEEGRGSSFWLRLPASRKRVSLMSDPHGLRGTALLVDDDEELLGVLSRQLARDGVSILTATTGPEALRLLREEKPGMLVLDLGLPVGDGFQVVDVMRKDPGLSVIPVLVYTGRDLTDDDRARLRLTPATRFLTKSKASDEDVRSAVLELLRPTSGLWKRS